MCMSPCGCMFAWCVCVRVVVVAVCMRAHALVRVRSSGVIVPTWLHVCMWGVCVCGGGGVWWWWSVHACARAAGRAFCGRACFLAQVCAFTCVCLHLCARAYSLLVCGEVFAGQTVEVAGLTYDELSEQTILDAKAHPTTTPTKKKAYRNANTLPKASLHPRNDLVRTVQPPTILEPRTQRTMGRDRLVTNRRHALGNRQRVAKRHPIVVE